MEHELGLNCIAGKPVHVVALRCTENLSILYKIGSAVGTSSIGNQR